MAGCYRPRASGPKNRHAGKLPAGPNAPPTAVSRRFARPDPSQSQLVRSLLCRGDGTDNSLPCRIHTSGSSTRMGVSASRESDALQQMQPRRPIGRYRPIYGTAVRDVKSPAFTSIFRLLTRSECDVPGAKPHFAARPIPRFLTPAASPAPFSAANHYSGK